MRRLTLGAAIAAIAAGPALAQESGGTMVMVTQPEPPNLASYLSTSGPIGQVAAKVYEGLIDLGPGFEIEPALAKAWEVSEDGLTITFQLQDGVTWHDGEPFTSADVVFSIDEFLRETHPRLRSSLVHLDRIEAPDDLTVVFHLKNAFGPFIGLFEPGTAPMIPRHVYEGTDYADNPANNTPIGTGPFEFEEWQRGAYIHLVRNEDYYLDGLPHLDEIYYQVIPDAASRAVAYETGRVDVLPGGSVENFDVARLTAMEDTCVTDAGWEFFGPLSWLWMNLDRPPLDDVLVRRAIMHGLDRQFALDALWNGLGEIATGPVSSSTRFHSAETPEIGYDPERARELLAESSYDGETIGLLALPYGETWQRWAEAVRQNLTEIGMEVEIVAADVAGWNQRVSDRDFDLAFTYLYQYGDPALGVSRTYMGDNAEPGSPWNNVANYQNPDLDAQWREAALMADPADREAAYAEIQAAVVEDVPNAWLLELGFPTIHRCSVKNLVTTAIGVNDGMRDAWIEGE
ncbi:MAG: ABC transporter substrate-binding protein [Paracoccaceae bacterium]